MFMHPIPRLGKVYYATAAVLVQLAEAQRQRRPDDALIVIIIISRRSRIQNWQITQTT